MSSRDDREQEERAPVKNGDIGIPQFADGHSRLGDVAEMFRFPWQLEVIPSLARFHTTQHSAFALVDWLIDWLSKA